MADHDPEQPLVGGSSSQSSSRSFLSSTRNQILIAVGLAFALIVIIVPVVVVQNNKNSSDNKSNFPVGDEQNLWNAVQANNVYAHLKSLQQIAEEHETKSRSVLNAYNASAEYVISQLQAHTDCDIELDYFTCPVFTQHSTPRLAYQANGQTTEFQHLVDFRQFRYGGSGVYNAPHSMRVVPNQGCDRSDWESLGDFANMNVALVDYPTSCDILSQVQLAEEFNATAVLVANTAGRFSLSQTRIRGINGYPTISLPVLSLSYSAGETLRRLNPIVQVFSNTTIVDARTYNVYCTTKTGRPDKKIVIGAHLDSVPEAPGMNDNGSGSATVLEIAIQYYKLAKQTNNQIMFAWWGAEEIGLLGSRHYVNTMLQNQTEFDKLALNLNFDMLASPNYIPMIHNGNPPFDAAKNGSLKITQIFEDYFNTVIQKTPGYTGMTGGSDFFPFVQAGIPAGGLAAGAGGVKTASQRAEFGGLAGAPLDPCYHQYCDDDLNINMEALSDLSGAASYVLEKLSERDGDSLLP